MRATVIDRIRAALLAAALCVGGFAAANARFETLDVAGGLMQIDWRGNYSDEQQGRLRSWLASVGESVTLLHGSLPRSPIRIRLTAYESARAAVGFGRVLRRDDPQGVEFFVNPERPLAEFVADWTAYHEMSHLFIPYPGRSQVWFSEGLASYYQNVLQYRAGLLTEQQAWQELYDGFERGRRDDRNRALTLAELTPQMREKHAFMRVYWSGALYFLEADLALRRKSGGKMCVDDMLREFGDCCLGDARRWTGREIAGEFDRIAGTAIFVPLFDRYESTTAIPDFVAPLAAAGVEVADARVAVAAPGFLKGVETRMNADDAG